ncbi:MAG: hypothetical protein QM538_05165 [Methylacidiphilales bacterium]|nr:hypothetical protein [Candidatus Methylacidiphilales bacterium]
MLPINYKNSKSQKGVALPGALLTLIILTALILSTYQLNTNEYLNAISYQNSTRSFLLTDSSLSIATRSALQVGAAFTIANVLARETVLPSLLNDINQIATLTAPTNNFFYQVACTTTAGACTTPVITIYNGAAASIVTELNTLGNNINNIIQDTTLNFTNIRSYNLQIYYLEKVNASSTLIGSGVGSGPLAGIVVGSTYRVNVRFQLRLNNGVVSTINQGVNVTL